MSAALDADRRYPEAASDQQGPVGVCGPRVLPYHGACADGGGTEGAWGPGSFHQSLKIAIAFW